MIDLKRVKEYIDIGFDKEEALKMVQEVSENESSKEKEVNNELEKKIEKLEAELKKDPEPEKEEPKKPPIEIENHEEKPLTVNEAFKNLFG